MISLISFSAKLAVDDQLRHAEHRRNGSADNVADIKNDLLNGCNIINKRGDITG
jgi:hypothetical protein